MSEERKPLWPWIAALLIGLPALYVASFGPACWLASRTGIGRSFLPVVFRPMTTVMAIDDSPEELRRRLAPPPGVFSHTTTALYFYPRGPLSKLASLWSAEGWKWRFVARVENSRTPVARMDEGHWEWCDSSKR